MLAFLVYRAKQRRVLNLNSTYIDCYQPTTLGILNNINEKETFWPQQWKTNPSPIIFIINFIAIYVQN